MTKIWIVEGSTGEYSDRRDWPVAAYKHETDALRHAQLAQRAADEIEAIKKRDDVDWYAHEPIPNPYDDGMTIDYNGVFYRAYPVSMRANAPVDTPLRLPEWVPSHE